MENNDSNEQHQDNSTGFEDIRPQADKGREPELIRGRAGTRTYSIAALVEKVVTLFQREHGDDSQTLRDADSETDKRRLLRDTVNYVLSVESVRLSPDDQARVVRIAFGELFGYGPLDEFFDDETVTTISLEGHDKVAVRHGHGELVSYDPIFDDYDHLVRIVKRLLRDADAELRDDEPYIETGLMVNDRPISVNLVAPPATIQMTVDIRVHPPYLSTIETFVDMPEARELLIAIARSNHGFVVVGEAESGKTTLLAMLLQYVDGRDLVAVERAGELHLPDGAQSIVPRWPVGQREGVSFGAQIRAVLTDSPSTLVLDEVRADEPGAIVPLLTVDQCPRLLWAFRGTAEHKRLAAALGMLARRGDPTRSETLVRSLYERLPFVIAMRRRKGQLQLHSISEWQFNTDADYPDFVELMAMGWGGIEFTGKRPNAPLDLPETFWT